MVRQRWAWMSWLACLLAPGGTQAWQAIPEGAEAWAEVSREHVAAYRSEQAVLLALDAEALEAGQLIVPRLASPIRSLDWINGSDAGASVPITLEPKPNEWILKWPVDRSVPGVIHLALERTPELLQNPLPIPASGDGSFLLHAWQAEIAGSNLRYEPQPHKNTIGYWTELDGQAAWTIQVDEPGAFAVAVLQGCGAGQGGSEARLSITGGGNEVGRVTFATVDTGHFQNFRWVHLGVIDITDQGEHEVKVEALRISKNALFDLRAVHLVRQASGQATR